jgi:hypothetical protein
MKNKNLFLGLLALVFAVGSAFASLDVSGQGYLKIKYLVSQKKYAYRLPIVLVAPSFVEQQ